MEIHSPALEVNHFVEKEKRMKEKETKTDITVIMDRSGSMHTMQDEAIKSFNRFLDSQKEASGKAKFSLVQFNHEIFQLCSGVPLEEAPTLDCDNYVPDGMTALLDAVGHTITETKKRMEKKNKWQVVVMVITDGMENSSKKFSGKEIKKLITKCEKKLDWKFIFLAADPSSFAQSKAYGFDHDRALMTGRGSESYVSAMDLVSAKLYRSREERNAAHLSFSDKEREEAMKLDQ